MHFYEIRFLPVWLQPIFLMKYRTNFAILETIHQHMVLFIKYHFLGSGELCMNYIHIGLNWLCKCSFNCHNVSRTCGLVVRALASCLVGRCSGGSNLGRVVSRP